MRSEALILIKKRPRRPASRFELCMGVRGRERDRICQRAVSGGFVSAPLIAAEMTSPMSRALVMP